MADRDLERFEAALNAVAKITSEGDPDLIGARCPKCNASDFARISDLFADAVGRIEDDPDSAGVVRVGGMTDAQIVAKFRPPARKSVAGVVLGVAIPLAAVAYYVHHRFSDTIGQTAIVVAIVAVVIVLMTSLRRFSDQYYDARRRWRHLFMCRNCGQLVAP
jgi:hypothetical protein